MSGPFGSSNLMFSSGGAAVEGQSLRFNDDDNAYLSWTPAAAGDRKTWTWSGWVKRGNLSTLHYLFGNSNGSNAGFHVRFDTNDTLAFLNYPSGISGYLNTSRVFRDVNAWYHIVLVWDTTNATSGDRMRIYINGERETDFGTESYPALNLDGTWNSTSYGEHAIGRSYYNAVVSSNSYFDGYMAEVNFVDGTALDPTSFGETDANGQWVPIKEPSVTYGTNGFYLPFTNDYEVEGFNTVTYKGNGGTQYIGGVGFDPDMVWIKSRSTTYDHQVYDSVRGVTKRIFPNKTDAELTGSDLVQSFDTDGFTVGTNVGLNSSSHTYVAWAWDMGTASAANTDGTISSTVRANPTYGQSIVAYLGTGADGTVGHGLSQAPELIIFKNRTSTAGYGWTTYSAEIGADKYLVLNNSAAQTTYNHFQDTNPTSSVFYLEGTSANSVNQSAANHIAYCFHSVAGYSDIGSYTGTGVAGNTVTTGFEPAFVMIKKTSSFGNWYIYDNLRGINRLQADQSDADYSQDNVDFLSDGFELTSTASGFNGSGSTYIYMAFADKREAAFWLDQSGNNNDWTNNNMQESDISLDNPTNNFATLNPIDRYPSTYLTLSEGNLLVNGGPTTGYTNIGSTFYQSTGKWYVEFIQKSRAASTWTACGLLEADVNHNGYLGQYTGTYAYLDNGGFYYGGSSASTGTSYAVGDVIAYAVDFDAGEIKMYKNNTLVYTFSSLTTGVEYAFGGFGYSSSDSSVINFGQDSSFAGNKVAQGNTDENGFGDFYYEPPAGYLALCTQNLPDSAIKDGTEHFNTALYTGNGSTQSITGVGFQPDLTWIKGRSVAYNHQLQDVVRGVSQSLQSDLTAAEANYGLISSFDADGFSLYTDGTYLAANGSGTTYAAWNWKAGGTGVANTDGSISSTVSANQTAGFSIVEYASGASGDKTVGHGLSSAPELIITKSKDSGSYNWAVYHADAITALNTFLRFNTSDAIVTAGSNIWGSAFPTSSVFGITSGNGVVASTDCIAYCFHSVEGYSKAGSFTGTGNADGPFVYTGFKPAFIIWKRSSATSNWLIWDNTRSPYNVVDDVLFPDLSNAESSSAASYGIDFLSNGFKLRNSNATVNGNGSTYIYMAFAESPFKYSNAR